MNLSIVIRRGAHSYDLMLEPGDYFVGRAKTSDIRIPLGVVSSRHLRLQYSQDVWTLTDLQSTNGTLVGEETLEPHVPLVVDQTITATIGEIEIELEPQVDASEASGHSMTITETGTLARQLVQDSLEGASDAAYIIVKAGPLSGSRFVVEAAPFLVGASEHAQIKVTGPDSAFSIHQSGDGFVVVVDVDPSAVQINGKPMSEPRQFLGEEAVIRFDDCELVFHDPLAHLLQDREAASAGKTTDSPTPVKVAQAVNAGSLASTDSKEPVSTGPSLLWGVAAAIVFAAAAAGIAYVATL